jgi:hypothetical protein
LVNNGSTDGTSELFKKVSISNITLINLDKLTYAANGSLPFSGDPRYNLIIEDPLKLAEHINNIWHNPYDWYNSKEIVNLRDYFMNYSLSISKTDDIFAQKKKWKKIFDNV